VRQAGLRGKGGQAELARLHSLNSDKAKESSLWLRVVPSSKWLELSDRKWQWAAQLRLGMPVPVYEPKAHADGMCAHSALANSNGWHPLTCMTSMGAEITQRHNAVLQRFAHFARLLNIQPIVEPAGLHPEDSRRPDIQLNLPGATLLGDVTISHPLAKSWLRTASVRGIEAVGDAREASKNTLYADMAEECDMEFSAIVLYTYGGFHKSALRFISRMAAAVDPATCLTLPGQWKRELMEQVAIAVQRGNADIMISAAQQQRGRVWLRRRYSAATHRHTTRSRGRGHAKATSCASSALHQQSRSRLASLSARLLGLPSSSAPLSNSDSSEADSGADTDQEDAVALSPSGSVVPETPLHAAGSPRSQDSASTDEQLLAITAQHSNILTDERAEAASHANANNRRALPLNAAGAAARSSAAVRVQDDTAARVAAICARHGQPRNVSDGAAQARRTAAADQCTTSLEAVAVEAAAVLCERMVDVEVLVGEQQGAAGSACVPGAEERLAV